MGKGWVMTDYLVEHPFVKSWTYSQGYKYCVGCELKEDHELHIPLDQWLLEEGS